MHRIGAQELLIGAKRLGTTKTRDWKEILQNVGNSPSGEEIMGDFVVL